jgi:eukaryotic-like serine/threonine-protein kinase
VLYEMLTGRAAFARETVTDTLAAVVSGAPEWTQLQGRVPARVSRIVRRCLERDPRQRLRDIGDARIELVEGSAEPLATDSVPPARAIWRLGPLAVAVVSFITGAPVAGVVA